MLQICICDDDNQVRGFIREELDDIIKGYGKNAMFYEYANGGECLAGLLRKPCSLAFLDIEMPGIDGFELAKVIQQNHKQTAIIFVTSHNEKVYEALEFTILSFVRKNLLREDLKKAIAKFLRSNVYEKIIFKQDGRISTAMVNLNDMIYFECDGHNITLVTQDKHIHMTGTLKKFEEDLEPYGFIRIHKNYLVNKAYISTLHKTQVELNDGRFLDMSRDRRTEIKKKFFC